MKLSAFSPGGLGPWFCALLFNASLHSKKQTHIFVHTHPHLALDSFNRTYATLSEDKKRLRRDSGECWIMILKIGPFESWHDATCFLESWLKRTRGKCHRIDRGLELFQQQQRQSPTLRMWTQLQNRSEAVTQFFARAASPEHDRYLTHPTDAEAPETRNRQALTFDSDSIERIAQRAALIVEKDADADLTMQDMVALHELDTHPKKRVKAT